MRWFAYNGDADGICSMVQWGLVHGIDGMRITGVKRDIMLLDRVNPQPEDEVIVMDISHARNQIRAVSLSSAGIDIIWFDHHLAGDNLANIRSYIDTSANVCTAKLVEKYLERKSDWAEVALHGDGLSIHSSKQEFKELGELLNYNGYGEDISDLHYHPDDLLKECLKAETPQKFMQSKAFDILKKGFDRDIANAESVEKVDGIYILPNEAWARRVVGVFAHRINSETDGISVIAIDLGAHLKISLRGPSGIGTICAKFGGGGRETAGGIDFFPKDMIPELMNEVNLHRHH